MKRRLKTEMLTRKQLTGQKKPGARTGSVGVQANFEDPEEEASKEFEESLMKLASFSKNRIKYEDFTAKDKFNILDLFVNNEKTLVKIYEALFPHRAKNLMPKVGSQASSGLSTDRTVGRYGYHSGVAPQETHSGTNPHLLQFATPGSKIQLHTQATPTPTLLMSPSGGSVQKPNPIYGSSLYKGKFNKNDSGAAATTMVSIHQSPREGGFNQDSDLMLPSIVLGTQSSLR